MLQAILLGIASQSSLVLSGLAVYWVKVPGKVIGCLAGFGAGALISAIAYDLIPEGEALSLDELALWLLIGAAVLLWPTGSWRRNSVTKVKAVVPLPGDRGWARGRRRP